MRRISVIDIGSNSIHMDTFLIQGKRVSLESGSGVFNKLGVYLSKSGELPLSKIAESVQILNRLTLKAKRQKVERVLIFGTSILRKALNRDVFCKRALAGTGLKIDVMSSARESGYVERIARARMRLGNAPVLLVDIGGGSTELVLMNWENTFLKTSYPYGLSFVKGRFSLTLRNAAEQREAMDAYFTKELGRFFNRVNQKKISRVFVFSSVAKTFGLWKYPAIKNWRDFLKKKISSRDLSLLAHQLATAPKEVAIDPNRKELVFIGAIFFQRLLKFAQVSRLEISPYSIREGYLIEYLARKEGR